MKHIRQTDFCFFQMDLSALNPAHIQYIIDQWKQMLTGRKNFAQIILNPFFVINITCSQCCKSNNRIHWCPDIMRHIGKKNTLRPICSLCRMDCLRKSLVHFPVRGTVWHNQNIFLFPVYLTSHCNIMKPAPFPCLPMYKFTIPLLLFMNRNFFQMILLRVFRICRVQFS